MHHMTLPENLHWGQFCHQKALASSTGSFPYHRLGKRSGALPSTLQRHRTALSITNALAASTDHAETQSPQASENRKGVCEKMDCNLI